MVNISLLTVNKLHSKLLLHLVSRITSNDMCIVDTSEGEFQHVKAGDRTPVPREVRMGDHEQYQYLHYPGERDFKH